MLNLDAKNDLQAVIIATYSEPVVPEQVRSLRLQINNKRKTY